MANQKLSALTAITLPAVGDLVYVVDVSDTADDAAGSSRKITLGDLTPWMNDLWGGAEAVFQIPSAGLGTKLAMGVAFGGFTAHRVTNTSAFTISGGSDGANGATLILLGGDVVGVVEQSQDETDYDNTPTTEGTFAGGTGHAISDVITVTGGSLVTVDAVSAGVVTQFTVDATFDVGNHSASDVLSQTATTGSGASFSLTLDTDNLGADQAGDWRITVDGNVVQIWDESEGHMIFYTGTGGSKTLTMALIAAGVVVYETLITAASTAARAGARLPHGSAPTSPANGDMWTTTAGLYVRINGSTVGPLA